MIEPVNEAAPRLPAHDDLTNMLSYLADHGDDDYLDIRMAGVDQPTLHQLFGRMAMFVAGVEPESNSGPDKARAIIEALHRIATIPAVFEKVTNVPYTRELANRMHPSVEPPELVPVQPVTDPQAQQYDETIASIRASGALRHDLLPPHQLVQLAYRPSEAYQARKGLLRRRPGFDEPITLKVSPLADGERNLRTEMWRMYNSYLDEYIGRVGTRTVPLQGVSELIAVDSLGELPKELTSHIGKLVRIGQVSVGSQLKLEGSFSQPKNELQSSPRPTRSSTFDMPLVLSQAYLGPTRNYPVFMPSSM